METFNTILVDFMLGLGALALVAVSAVFGFYLCFEIYEHFFSNDEIDEDDFLDDEKEDN